MPGNETLPKKKNLLLSSKVLTWPVSTLHIHTHTHMHLRMAAHKVYTHIYPFTSLCVDMVSSSQAGFLAVVIDSIGALVQCSGGKGELERLYTFHCPVVHCFRISCPHICTHTLYIHIHTKGQFLFPSTPLFFLSPWFCPPSFLYHLTLLICQTLRFFALLHTHTLVHATRQCCEGWKKERKTEWHKLEASNPVQQNSQKNLPQPATHTCTQTHFVHFWGNHSLP